MYMYLKSTVIIMLAFYFQLSQSEKDVVGKMKEIIQTVSGIGYSAPVESTTSAPDTAETFVESITPEIPEPNRDGSTIESLTCCCCAEGRCDL